MHSARKAWGCDGPAPFPVFEVTCSACAGGMSLEVGDKCGACNGLGTVWFDRCPTSVLRNIPLSYRATVETAIRAYIQYDTRHVMPSSGGYVEQTAYFGAVVDIIDSERGRLDEIVNDKRDRERKASEMKQQQGAAGKGRVHRPNFGR